jgi:hypothetical protein
MHAIRCKVSKRYRPIFNKLAKALIDFGKLNLLMNSLTLTILTILKKPKNAKTGLIKTKMLLPKNAKKSNKNLLDLRYLFAIL